MWTKPDNIWFGESNFFRKKLEYNSRREVWYLNYFVEGRGWEWAANLEYDKEKKRLIPTQDYSFEFFTEYEFEKFKTEGLPAPADWRPPQPEYEWVPRPQKEWEKALIAKYPRLYDAEMRFDLSGDGWRKLCEEFSAELDQIIPKDKKISVSVKTKHARLTIYVHVDGKFEQLADSLADDYAEKSTLVCETCGEPGSWGIINEYWEYISCPEHKGHDPRDNEVGLWKGYGYRPVQKEESPNV